LIVSVINCLLHCTCT